jgi:hypothetical protein
LFKTASPSRVLSSRSWARELKPIKKYSSASWLVWMNRERASRAFLTLSPLIEPDTSKSTPTETGASSSLKYSISCSTLSSKTLKAFLSRPET